MTTLLESVTHVLDLITQEVNNDNFDPALAGALLGVDVFVHKMQQYNYDAIERLAMEPASDTVNRIKKFAANAPPQAKQSNLQQFNKDNKVFIMNEIQRIRKAVMSLYNEAGVQVYNNK